MPSTLIDIEEFKYRAFCHVFELQVRQALYDESKIPQLHGISLFTQYRVILDDKWLQVPYKIIRSRKLTYPGNQVTHPVHIDYAYFKKRPGLYYVVLHAESLAVTVQIAALPHVIYFNGNMSLSI